MAWLNTGMNLTFKSSVQNSQSVAKQGKRWNRVLTAGLFHILTVFAVVAIDIFFWFMSGGKSGIHSLGTLIIAIPLFFVNVIYALVNVVTVLVYVKNGAQSRRQAIIAVLSLVTSLTVIGYAAYLFIAGY
ncbi:MAG: hypothetical protein V4678_04540 [Patescibacteria group bacterium]